MIPISVLDLVPLPSGGNAGEAIRNSLELAQLADRLGFVRYWFAEHHNMPTIASTTPEVLIPLAAEKTSRIHVGSGGVMLPNHAPLKVAETYKMLESLFPGRIDLGIGRAPGTDPASALALRGSREALSGNDFPAQLMQLLDYGEGGVVSPLRQKLVTATPQGGSLPPIWLLGSSDFSARLSAELGMGFAFAAHFSDLPPELPLRLYRETFQPGFRPNPHAILTLSVICAPTAEEAERLMASAILSFAKFRTGQEPLFLPAEEAAAHTLNEAEEAVAVEMRARTVWGTPEQVARRIDDLVVRTGADEVMVTTMVHNHAHRRRSYELLSGVAVEK